MDRLTAIKILKEDKELYQSENCWAGDGSPDGELILALEMAIDTLDAIERGRLIVTPETGIGDLSDGYHTFNELYHHRAVLFSVICNSFKSCAWKSKKHNDGTMYGGMFIVGIDTPEGSATYHYDIEPYWDMFDVKELDKAPEWDGHTPDDAINRIAALSKSNRLIELPCAVGDTVWEVQEIRRRIQALEIIAVHIGRIGGIFFEWELKDGEGIYKNISGFRLSSLNETIFLTKEEAEAKLKELEK